MLLSDAMASRLIGIPLGVTHIFFYFFSAFISFST